MRTTLAGNPIAYRDYKRMIYKKGHYIANTYRLEFDEVVGQCNYVFTRCLQSYDPETGASFCTYLHGALNRGMAKWVKKQMKYRFEEAVPNTCYYNPSIVSDLMDTLDDDSKKVLHLVLNRPTTMKITGKDSNFKIKIKTYRHLQKDGWSREKTLSCFGKIKGKLNELGRYN